MRLNAKPEQILDICQRNGLEVSYASGRFRFRFCPICGSDRGKLWLYEKTYAGSCFKCHTTFNLITLFQAHELPLDEIRRLGHYGAIVPVEAMSLTPEDENNAGEPPKPIPGLDKSRYFRIDEWPDHPAAKYATSRGVPAALFDVVLIDIVANAVTFLVFQEGNLVGYQSRYVRPANPNMKTYTAKDFKTSECVLEYHRPEGDIFLCEGPFSAISAYNFGHTGLCVFGSKLSQFQLNRFCQLGQITGKRLCCAFDLDDPGWHAYLQVKEFCSMRGLEVLKVEPETGNDLNDSWKAGKSYKEVQATATSLLQYLPEL